jgi:hypothetical protein
MRVGREASPSAAVRHHRHLRLRFKVPEDAQRGTRQTPPGVIEIVRKQAGQIDFAVHPGRWVVEHSLPGSDAIAVSSKT